MASNDKVSRETDFYKELCSELLLFVADHYVHCWLTPNQKNEFNILMAQFQTNLHVNPGPPGTELEALQTLQNLQTLAGKIIRFYSKSYPLASQISGIINWRWWHVSSRAVHWREIARSHDWSEYLLITPAHYQDEEWWQGEISTTLRNAYLVSD